MSIRSVLALAALASPVSAQCLDWSPAFEVAGLGAGAQVRAAAVYDDGTGPALYAGGQFSGAVGNATPRLARWNGQEWSSIGATDRPVDAMVVFDDGSGPKLYAGGGMSTIGGVPTGCVGRWDGSAWSAVGDLTAWNFGTVGGVSVLAIHDDGNGPRLYAGGFFYANDETLASGVARWDGAAWTVIGRTNDFGFVRAFATFDDGEGPSLAVGGEFSQVEGHAWQGLAQWKGGVWYPLAGNTHLGYVYALARHDDGTGDALYIGGSFSSIAGVAAESLAKWGGMSITPVPGIAVGSQLVKSLVTHDDGTGPVLYVGGYAMFIASNPSLSSVARWDGTTWSALASGIVPNSNSGGVWGFVPWDDGSGPGLAAVGGFDIASGVVCDGLALWRGGAWSPFGRETGVRGKVLTSARFDSGSGSELVVAGEFVHAGGKTCNHIARWDGESFQSLGAGVGGVLAPAVRAVCEFDAGAGPELYAGGSFLTVDGMSCANLARWNGSTWTPMFVGGATSSITAMCVHDDGSGPALFVAGRFTMLGSQNIAKWNGSSWLPLGSGCIAAEDEYDAISALASYDDGGGSQLYAGGLMFIAGGVNTFYLARWNGSAWSSVGSGLSAPYTASNGVKALHVANLGAGSKLYVGGGFDAAGGHVARNIAVWDGSWSALATSGTATPGRVGAIVSFDTGDGRGPALYLHSSFVADDGQATNGLARYDAGGFTSVGGGISPVFPYVDTRIGDLGVFDDGVEPGEDLYVGATFRAADGTLCVGLGRLRGCGEVGTSFCFGDGSATACPCGNASAVGERAGCLNSLGTGGTVRARGVPSVTSDTLVLDGGGMTNSSVLYFQGASLVNGGAGTTFGDGLRCVGNPIVRLGSKENVGGASSYPTGADLSISTKGFVTSPVTRHYSARYRNPAAFCTPDTFNYTSAVSIHWRP